MRFSYVVVALTLQWSSKHIVMYCGLRTREGPHQNDIDHINHCNETEQLQTICKLAKVTKSSVTYNIILPSTRARKIVTKTSTNM
mgnify:CR=1 FL=1